MLTCMGPEVGLQRLLPREDPVANAALDATRGLCAFYDECVYDISSWPAPLAFRRGLLIM